MIDNDEFRIMIEKLLLKIIKNPIPGKVIDLEPIFKWEILPGRRISWYSYKTGETEIWQLPEHPDPTMMKMIKGPEIVQ